MTEPATREQVAADQPVGDQPGGDQRVGDTAEPMEFTVLGMSCASCANRIERKLNKLPGAQAVVNFATERAVVRGLELAETDTVVAAVEKAGYRAIPDTEDDHTDHRAAQLRSLRRRILVAGVLTLPLSNLTIGLALVDSLRFPGWEILCVALATPVVLWAAWPFHRATWRNLQQRST
ncbi:MAG: cation transporter, partial [Propionibacteriales bacterium]|nr:cation transporter [Propionibacteriales bacterium]